MKNTRETKMIFSNVKSNKKKAEEKSASKSDEIFDYNNESVIGLKVVPEPKIPKEKKNKKKKEESDELDIPFQKEDKRKRKKFGLFKKAKRLNNNKKKKIKVSKHNNPKHKILLLEVTKWLTLLIAIVAALILLLISSIFDIKTIEISGNDKLSKETIESMSGVKINDNLIKVRNSEIIKKLKQNAYIENVEVTKKLTDKIEIKVQERVATFTIKIGEGYAYINNQGYVLEIVGEKNGLPTVIGQTTENDKLISGNRLNKEDLVKLEMVLKIRDAAQSNELEGKITGIDISDDNNYKVIFENENKVAYIGDCSNLSTRMLYVKAMLEKEKGKAGEIFVDVDLNKEYPFFRETV